MSPFFFPKKKKTPLNVSSFFPEKGENTVKCLLLSSEKGENTVKWRTLRIYQKVRKESEMSEMSLSAETVSSMLCCLDAHRRAAHAHRRTSTCRTCTPTDGQCRTCTTGTGRTARVVTDGDGTARAVTDGDVTDGKSSNGKSTIGN